MHSNIEQITYNVSSPIAIFDITEGKLYTLGMLDTFFCKFRKKNLALLWVPGSLINNLYHL